MQLEHCKRSRFINADDARGAEAEDWVYTHLLHHYPEDKVHWHNKYGRSFKIDFVVDDHLLEVERKARKFWWMGVKYGFTFLAPKCHQFIEWDDDVRYMLVKGDRSVFVSATIVEIMLHGTPVRKKTKRGWDWFYQVPYDKLRRGKLAR